MDDVANEGEESGTGTPSVDTGDEFFSSWDKPAIKRPSNPPSRTGTPGVPRTGTPLLNPNQNGATARPKSPLIGVDASNSAAPTPTTARAVASSAVKKPAVSSRPKANILGAKKTKLGAKKVDAAALDFDEAEKKAKEEAERKEKLGYDPDEETPSESQFVAAQPETNTTIHQPKPVNPGSFGATAHSRQRSESEMERLGMGVRRLGFGQVGGGSPAKAPAPKAMGFGAVSKSSAAQGKENIDFGCTISMLTTSTFTDDSERYAREKFGTQKGISSDEFFGRNNFDPNAQTEARTRLQGFEGATSISSNAYFGRPDEEEMDLDQYGDLETAARDFVRKFGITAGDDLENLSSMLGEGATKLQGAIRNYLNS